MSASSVRHHIRSSHQTLVISTALVLAASSLGCSNDPGPEPRALPEDSGPADMPSLNSGGADSLMGPVHNGLFQIIDDLEASSPGDTLRNFVSPVGLGSWFFTAPPKPGLPMAVVAAVDPSRGSSQRAWRVPLPEGSAPVSLRVDLHGPKFPAVPFADLSAYAGIAFWSRGSLPSIHLVAAVEDSASGRVNVHQAGPLSGPLGFTQPVKVGSEWRRHIILFDDLVALDESKGKLDTTALWAVNFVADSASAAELWIDDVALLCKGACPPPPFELEPSAAPGLDATSLQWTGGSGANSCGELASLTMDSLQRNVVVGEKIFLNARVRGAPNAEVPAWLWRGKHTQTHEQAAWNALDEGSSMAALSFPSPGTYTVGAHSHYPGTATCSVETTITVVP